MSKKAKLIKTLLSFLIFISIHNIKAQSYFQLLDSGKVWIEQVYSFGNPAGKSDFFLNGDTIINNTAYKKIFQNIDDPWPPPPTYSAACREDTGNKRVYIVPSGDTIEYLLYDFSVNAGDTVSFYKTWGGEQQTRIIAVIDTIMINGNCVKRFKLNGCVLGIPDYWIEGIGSENGLLNPTICVTDYTVVLEQVIQNQFEIYNYLSPQPQPVADFFVDSINGNGVYFNNTSNNACTYKWYFGDGNSSILENPFYIYLDTGSYNVTLIASTSDNINIITKLVQIGEIVGLDGITDENSLTIQVYPNPFINETIIILPCSNEDGLSLIFTLYNILGEKQDISYTLYITKDRSEIKLNRGDLQPGLYFYKVKSKNRSIGIGKLIINN